MTNLKETAQWEDGIYQLETSDPVLGGPDGVDNLQAKQLANRTAYLKDKIDGQQKDKVSKAGDTMQGALRGKSGAATGNNTKNAGFVFEGDADSGMFSPEDGKLEIAANGEAKIVLIAGKGIFVKDWASFAAGVVADAFDQGGGQFRAIQGDYGAFLRNDGTSVYLLSTKAGDPNGQWNDYRPLTWNLKTGYVTVDANGNGTGFGGNVSVSGDALVGKSAKWQSGKAGAWINVIDAWSYFRTNGNMSLGSEAEAGYLQFVSGGKVRAQFVPSGRFLLNTGDDDGGAVLQVGGQVKGINGIGALRASNGGGVGQTSILLTRESASKDARQWEVLHAGDGAIALRIINDAYSDARSALDVTRKTKPADQPGGEPQTLFDLNVMRLMPSGGVVAVGGDADSSGDRFQVRGSARFDGDVVIRNGETEAHLRLGPVDGYWYGGKESWGFWSEKFGAMQYVIADKALKVDGHTVWHEGNVAPLDVNKGGKISGHIEVVDGLSSAGRLNGVNAANLLFNGSGQFGAAGWSAANMGGIDTKGPVLAAVLGAWGEGNFWQLSRELDGTVDWYVDYSDMVWTSPGATLTLQAELFAGGLSGGNFYVNAEFYDGSSTPKYIGEGGKLTAAAGVGWTFKSVSFTVPSDARQVRVRKVIDGKPKAAGGTLACRRIKLEWGTSASLYSIEADLPRVALLDSPKLTGTPTAPTPAPDDKSARLATTEWVASAIATATATIGQIVFEPRTTVRAGYVKCNGAELNRADYPALWAYAQASGALVEESDWGKNNWGCFSKGNGNTTFCVPELRGEFIRCWADGRDDIDPKRGIGTSQNSANLYHSHGASSAAAGDHNHSAWTDQQGWHGHHGWTGNNGGHNHGNGIYTRLLRPPHAGSITGSDTEGSGTEQAVGGGDSADIAWAGDHNHEFNTEGAGTHGHNVGIGSAGSHSHSITVNADGGTEARPRNVAMLAMIRAY